MNILGISCYYHDSAACLLKNGVVIAAAEEERFTRKKHDNNFPKKSISCCLKEGRIDMRDIDIVAFYEKPLLKLDRILQMSLETYPKSFLNFYKILPGWLTSKLKIPSKLKKKLNYNGKIFFTEHHQSHAASAFFASPFKEAAIITVDGVGEWSTISIHYGKDNEIKTLKETYFPNSLGLLYSTITAYLGFKVLSDEYKVMGLAAYGKPSYYEKFKEKLIDVKEDGSFSLNMDYFSYIHKEQMFSNKFEKEFGKRRNPGDNIEERHKDIAASLQKVTEEIMSLIANHAYKLTNSKNLCMAGGVALNCVANGKLLQKRLFEKIFIQPAATDAGGSIGAALYTYHQILKKDRSWIMNSAYLGPSFNNKEIKNFLDKNQVKYTKLSDKNLVKNVANLLSQDKIVGWFQGRMEFGPRALGNRSILANPKNPEMKDIVNKKVKHREEFRPFAPSILIEKASKYLMHNYDSPFMTINFETNSNARKKIISATHVDGTARAQTISQERNKLFYDLIKEFEKLTNVPALLNTSFNVKGEPIVCNLEDAYNCFMNTGIDYLVLGNYLISKD